MREHKYSKHRTNKIKHNLWREITRAKIRKMNEEFQKNLKGGKYDGKKRGS